MLYMVVEWREGILVSLFGGGGRVIGVRLVLTVRNCAYQLLWITLGRGLCGQYALMCSGD